MTSRERILASINHREPDKIPVDMGSTPSSGISAIAYNNLTKYLGLKDSQTLIYDVVQELAQPEDSIIDRFGIDVIDVGREFNTEASDWYNMTLSDNSKARYPQWFKPQKDDKGNLLVYNEKNELIAKKPVGATFFDQTLFPYLDGYPDNYGDLPAAMNKVLWQALAHSPWDNAGDENFWDKLREKAIYLRQNTDKAVMMVAGCNLFEWGTFLRRMDNFLMDLFIDPDNVKKMLDALLELHLAGLEKICRTVGDVVDVVRLGDDLGTDNGPFMPREMYQEIFKPRHKQIIQYIKEHSNMKILLHSCGGIFPLIPDLIDIGLDIINPVQTNAHEMEPARLKQEYGKDITFWGGGIDTRTVLNNATPGKVKEQVTERLEIFSKGGGFVFNTVHNILPDVPPENIVAMFDAIKEFNSNR
jgi:uroporphyrinogen decarboxylase